MKGSLVPLPDPASLFPLPLQERAGSPGTVVVWREDGGPIDPLPDSPAALPPGLDDIVQLVSTGKRGRVLGAIRKDGSVVTWGDAPEIPAGVGPAVALEFGTWDNTMWAVLHEDGTVTARGPSFDEQALEEIEDWENIARIRAGSHWLFGLTTEGQLLFAGNEHRKGSWKPVLDLLSTERLIDIGATWTWLMVIQDDWTIRSWEYGKAFDKYTVPGARRLSSPYNRAFLIGGGFWDPNAGPEGPRIPGLPPLEDVSGVAFAKDAAIVALREKGRWHFIPDVIDTIEVDYCNERAEGCTDLVYAPPYVIAIRPE